MKNIFENYKTELAIFAIVMVIGLLANLKKPKSDVPVQVADTATEPSTSSNDPVSTLVSPDEIAPEPKDTSTESIIYSDGTPELEVPSLGKDKPINLKDGVAPLCPKGYRLNIYSLMCTEGAQTKRNK